MARSSNSIKRGGDWIKRRALLSFGAMLMLSEKWALYLSNQPETGMGYCIASVYLSDGRVFEDAVIDSGHITRIGYSLEIPFTDADIEKIVVTHGTKFRRGFWNKPILQDLEK